MAVEASFSDVGAAERLVRSGLEDRCLRVLLEPQEPELPAALRTVEAMECGVDATAWLLLQEAGRRGYDARIGLEDTRRLPGGELAGDNLDLVRAARAWNSEA